MNSDTNLSDLALANVEALAVGETGREDCDPADNEECLEFYSSPNGNVYSVLFNHKKKPGWT